LVLPWPLSLSCLCLVLSYLCLTFALSLYHNSNLPHSLFKMCMIFGTNSTFLKMCMIVHVTLFCVGQTGMAVAVEGNANEPSSAWAYRCPTSTFLIHAHPPKFVRWKQFRAEETLSKQTCLCPPSHTCVGCNETCHKLPTHKREGKRCIDAFSASCADSGDCSCQPTRPVSRKLGDMLDRSYDPLCMPNVSVYIY
jgi:hypothetical protein